MAIGAVIGSLRANLSLNSAQFDRGLKNARRSLSRMQDNMRKMAVGAGIAGTALGTMGAQAISSARDIDRLSQAANATPKQLQRWSAATRTVGIDQEKLSDILKDVNDRVGDFVATGGGPMADFFENIAPKVGVTAAQFERLSGPEALQLYVSSLEKAGVSQQQMTFYMEAMASDATLLLPLLRANGQEMTRLGDAAEAAGGEMSNEAIANLTKMGETSDRIRDSFIAMRGEVAGALASSFERLAGVMQKAMGEGGLLRRVMVALADNADRITAYVGTAAGAFAAYAAAVSIATLVTKGFRTILIRTGIGALIVGLGEAVHQFIQLKNAVGSSGKAFGMFADLAKGAVNYGVEAFFWLGNRIIGTMRGAFNAMKEIWNQLPAVLGSLMIGGANAVVGTVEKMINKIKGLFNKFLGGVNSALSLLPDWAGGGSLKIGLMPDANFAGIKNPWAEQAKDAGKKASEAFIEGFRKDTKAAPKVFDVPAIERQWNKIQNIVKKSKGTSNASKALEGLKAKLDDVAEMPKPGGAGSGSAKTPAAAIDEMSDAAKRAQSAVGTLRDGMAGVFSSVMRGAEGARSAVSKLLDRLADMATQNAFKSLFNSVAGNGVGGGGQPNIFGKILGSIFGSTPAFANGGVAPGGLTMVGERGPELANMPAGTRIHSAAETARMLGDGGGQGGGALEIVMAEGLEARWLKKAEARSVRVTRAGIEEYDRSGAPRRMAAYEQDKRRRG